MIDLPILKVIEPLIHTDLLRLGLSVILGGLVGYERELAGKDSGVRTHALVSLGSCLAMTTAAFLAHGNPAVDITRFGAQVISGVGFLGAGTIMRHGVSVKGLTTAASLWVVACIGLAVGAGAIYGAVVGTLLSLFSLRFIPKPKPRKK